MFQPALLYLALEAPKYTSYYTKQWEQCMLGDGVFLSPI